MAAIAVHSGATGGGRARAQAAEGSGTEREVALFWRAPEQCPDEAWVREEIERLIDRPLYTGDAPVITAIATVRRGQEGGWILGLRTVQHGKRGLRELKAGECHSLAEAAALILALSIDPRAVERRRAAEAAKSEVRKEPSDKPVTREGGVADTIDKQPEPDTIPDASTPEPVPERGPMPEAEPEPQAEPEPDDGSEPEAETELEDELEPEPRAGSRTPVGLALRLEALGEAGALPGLGAGMGAAVALLLDRLRLEGSVGYWPARQAEVEEISGIGGDLALVAGAAGCCYRAWGERLSLSPCAHLELGSMYGKGRNVTRSLQDSALWSALVAGARAGWKVTGWGVLVLEFGLAASLLRPGYTLWVQGVTDRALVHRPAALAPRLRAGIELQL